MPNNEAVEIIKNKFDLPGYIIDLISHCLKTTYFRFNKEWYKQIDGAPIESPFSPVIANLLLTYFEEHALETAEYTPKAWLLYVDNTFVIWSHGHEKLLQKAKLYCVKRRNNLQLIILYCYTNYTGFSKDAFRAYWTIL